jgi:hypothetical protein
VAGAPLGRAPGSRLILPLWQARLASSDRGGVSHEWLVYAGERGVYVADADGANVRYVRGQPFNNALNYDPAWSSDQRRIVFSNNETLYTIAADGGDLHRIGPGTNPAGLRPTT